MHEHRPSRDGLSPFPEGQKETRTSLLLLAGYLTATLPTLFGTPILLVVHIALLGVVIIGARTGARATWRMFVPLALGPWLYIELRWIIAGAGFAHRDALVTDWDAHLPFRLVAHASDAVAMSEVLHLCYLAYYALVYAPPVLLWWRGRRDAFARTVLALMVVYGICFAAFILFPVDGPRFLHGPAPAPDGPVRRIVLGVLEAGSSRGTAFPSAHVAASLVASLCALRFARPLGVVMLAITGGLAIGAVYGGFHYAIDIVAGAFTGIVSFAMARALERVSDGAPATPR